MHMYIYVYFLFTYIHGIRECVRIYTYMEYLHIHRGETACTVFDGCFLTARLSLMLAVSHTTHQQTHRCVTQGAQ